MSMADLIPMLLATRMEPKQTVRALTDEERRARYREHNKRRDEWREKRRAQGLSVT